MPTWNAADLGAIERAADRLAAGELVAFPTETVYGLGARADDDAAVARIFEAKGRPADHPLIVHAADAAGAAHFGDLGSTAAQHLSQRHWPGPLTLIVPRRPGIADGAAAGRSSVGLRVPGHPVALALLRAAAQRGVPGVAGPSANRFGRVSPTLARHVVDEFGPELAVLDGGACQVGIESTIIDCTGPQATLRRPGMLGRAAVAQAIGAPLAEPPPSAPRVSGTLDSHYAPDATLRLMDTRALRGALEVLGDLVPPGLAVYSRTLRSGPPGVLFRRMPDQPGAAAQELFAALRDFDARAARLIWVEAPPDGPDWEGLRDRLRRAAAG